MFPTIKIKEEQNKIHDNTLDIMGSVFNFNHEKGLAEWLKNSMDAYLRINVNDKDQYIIYRFTDGVNSNAPTIECIDFVGMTYTDIQKAFMWWGDPNAAKRGLKVKTYGGHGNGGKFYMRQMFFTSQFITYRDGKLNIFGFNENRKYGFAEGFLDKTMSLDEALNIANLDKTLIPSQVYKKMLEGNIGFTVVRGVRPKKYVGNKLPIGSICEKLKYHPQARRPLKYCNVSVIHNSKLVTDKLRMEDLEPLKGFEQPETFEIPNVLFSRLNPNKKIEMENNKYPKGKLILRTSSVPFGHGGKKSELNCIDVVGEIGVIASYEIKQIGPLRYYPQAQSIYGECYCPILEDPDYDCVTNDREKLVENDRTKVLLEWICTKIDELGFKLAEIEQKDVEKKNSKTTDEFNQILNQWKNQFMSKLFAEVLGGPGKGSSTGGLGANGSGGGKNNESEKKDGLGSGAGEGGGEGENKLKGNTLPRVLISEQEDPDYPGVMVTFSERHFPVEQRQQDFPRGIYWINKNKPLAKKIIQKYGVDSPQWRNYLFQRYVDIFMKEIIWRKAKQEGGSLTPEVADTEIMRVASLVYDKAATDLESFLLDDRFSEDTSNAFTA